MRKASLFLTLLILAALLLAACGGEETSTSAPGTNVPPATEEATSTEMPTEPAATEPAGTTDTTTTPNVPVTGEESPNRLTNLMDYDVLNQNGEQIGNADDMVLDFDNTTISYVLVGTGGFLGLGEKTVAVPWDMLEMPANSTAGEQNAFVFTGDQEFYNNAPDFDVPSMLPDMGAQMDDWDADIRSYWESGVAPGTDDGTSTPETSANPTAAETGTTEGTDQGQNQTQVQQLQGVMLASDILGSTVVAQVEDQGQDQNQGEATADPNATSDPNATAIPQGTASFGTDNMPGTGPMSGTMDDLIVDPATGELQYLVISGDFAEGQRLIPVPLSSVMWDAANQTFVIQVDPAALQNAPTFEDGQFPDMSAEGWNSEIDQFWQNPSAGASGGGAAATATP